MRRLVCELVGHAWAFEAPFFVCRRCESRGARPLWPVWAGRPPYREAR